jgi:hypothetical protein
MGNMKDTMYSLMHQQALQFQTMLQHRPSASVPTVLPDQGQLAAQSTGPHSDQGQIVGGGGALHQWGRETFVPGALYGGLSPGK